MSNDDDRQDLPDSYDHCARIVRDLALVRQSLAHLPPSTLKAFALYRMQGLTQPQIAHRLDVPLAQVNFMIAAAIDALKVCRLP